MWVSKHGDMVSLVKIVEVSGDVTTDGMLLLQNLDFSVLYKVLVFQFAQDTKQLQCKSQIGI